MAGEASCPTCLEMLIGLRARWTENARLGGLLGSIWEALGALMGLFGTSGRLLGPSWRLLGAS